MSIEKKACQLNNENIILDAISTHYIINQNSPNSGQPNLIKANSNYERVWHNIYQQSRKSMSENELATTYNSVKNIPAKQ